MANKEGRFEGKKAYLVPLFVKVQAVPSYFVGSFQVAPQISLDSSKDVDHRYVLGLADLENRIRIGFRVLLGSIQSFRSNKSRSSRAVDGRGSDQDEFRLRRSGLNRRNDLVKIGGKVCNG